MNSYPNIIFIHTDQHRGDCLSIENHPVLQTPNIDGMALKGVRFTKFYSACPSCIAARRCILTGMTPQTLGIVGYCEGMEFDLPTLPSVLKSKGYQTYHIGRSMHQWPPRKRYGFDDMEIMGIPPRFKEITEYEEWFSEHAPLGAKGSHGIGIMHNDWTAAPWHLDDYLHPSNWTINRALRFFERRDPTAPFFLSLGFLAPHPPLQPPRFYFERYLRTGVSQPVIGDWAKKPDMTANNIDYVSNIHVNLTGERLLTARAGYYGLINHVDDLLRLLLNPILGVARCSDRPTIIIFTSDHGEMLGDHYLWRKSRAYEASARVPFIVQAPDEFGIKQNITVDYPATHADIMPTILDILNIEVPSNVEGISLYPLMKGEKISKERKYIHIEHAPYHQCVTDGKYKFIWTPHDGEEQFFDLQNDPNELHNLINRPEHSSIVSQWRKTLIECLRNRPEGFVHNDKLIPGRPYHSTIIPIKEVSFN